MRHYEGQQGCLGQIRPTQKIVDQAVGMWRTGGKGACQEGWGEHKEKVQGDAKGKFSCFTTSKNSGLNLHTSSFLDSTLQ